MEEHMDSSGVAHVLSSSAPAQNTAEWLEWRKFRLTASDCAKIIGSAVKSRARLIGEKTGKQQPWQGNAYTQAGHDFEGEAIAAYERLKGVKVITNLFPVAHPEHPRLAASLDGMTEGGINVEIKCISDLKKHKKEKRAHFYQAQFQMACASLKVTHLVYYYLKLNPEGQVCDNMRCERLLQIFEIKFDAKWFSTSLPKFLDFVKELDEEPCPFLETSLVAVAAAAQGASLG